MNSSAQISQGGTPYSFTNDSISKQTSATITLQNPDLNVLAEKMQLMIPDKNTE